jgi:hypothetical protein
MLALPVLSAKIIIASHMELRIIHPSSTIQPAAIKLARLARTLSKPNENNELAGLLRSEKKQRRVE